jgi:ABC-type Fe3+-siderophore transport system permease subunit
MQLLPSFVINVCGASTVSIIIYHIAFRHREMEDMLIGYIIITFILSQEVQFLPMSISFRKFIVYTN